MVVVGVVRRGAYQVHSPQLEAGECAHHNDQHLHDSHNHHSNHQTHSQYKDQGKVDHTLLDEGEVCGTYHGHLVLLGVVVGHPVVDHRNHDRVVLRLVCRRRDLCHGMNHHHHQDVLNDHPCPWSNGQIELEEVEHDSRV